MMLSTNTNIIKNSRYSYTIRVCEKEFNLTKTEILSIVTFAINTVMSAEEKDIYYKKLEAFQPYLK